MKVERIDVLNFYVKDLEQAVKFFSELMGSQFIGPLVKKGFPGYPERQRRFAVDNMGLYLLQTETPDDPYTRWIEEHGEGLAVIGLKVPDLEEAIAELQTKGFTLDIKSTGKTVASVKGKPLSKSDMKVAILTAPEENTYGGLRWFLLEYKDAPGFAMATLRKLGDLPWM